MCGKLSEPFIYAVSKAFLNVRLFVEKNGFSTLVCVPLLKEWKTLC